MKHLIGVERESQVKLVACLSLASSSFHNRLLLNLISPAIKSEQSGVKVLLMLWQITRWTSLSPAVFHFYLHFFPQNIIRLDLGSNQISAEGLQQLIAALRKGTVKLLSLNSFSSSRSHFTQVLTSLDLSGNHIGATGAKNIAEAIGDITVHFTWSLYFRIYSIMCICIDPQRAQSQLQSDRRYWHPRSVSCFTNEHGKLTLTQTFSLRSWLFYIVINGPVSLRQRNRPSRKPLSRLCFDK